MYEKLTQVSYCLMMDQETRIELTVSGYIRNVKGINIQIPEALIKIIFKFHQRMWRFVRHSTHSVDFLDISEDGHEIALKVTLRHQHILYPNTTQC